MWSPLPLDPPNKCAVCQSGDAERGPFWNGPRLPTELLGPKGRVKARFALCRGCIYVLVNAPDSPFHGLLPAGLESESVKERAAAEIGRLKARNDELEATGGLPASLARAAVVAAVEELDRRGLVAKQESSR